MKKQHGTNMQGLAWTRKKAAVKHLLKSLRVNAMYIPNWERHNATSLARAALSMALMALSPT